MTKLTREQAAIIGAYTGVTCGPFSDIHSLADRLIGRPVWTHDFADKDFVAKLKELCRADFLAICADQE